MSDLTFRPPEPRDIDALQAIYQRPAVYRGTSRAPFTPRSYFEERIPLRDPNLHAIIVEQAGDVVGWGHLNRHLGRRAHCATLAVTVHDAFHRQGIGRSIMAQLLDLADNWLGLIRVELEVNPDNHGAVALYRAFGFADEGIRRATLVREGTLIDSLMMGRVIAPPSHGPAPAPDTGVPA